MNLSVDERRALAFRMLYRDAVEKWFENIRNSTIVVQDRADKILKQYKGNEMY